MWRSIYYKVARKIQNKFKLGSDFCLTKHPNPSKKPASVLPELIQLFKGIFLTYALDLEYLELLAAAAKRRGQLGKNMFYPDYSFHLQWHHLPL